MIRIFDFRAGTDSYTGAPRLREEIPILQDQVALNQASSEFDAKGLLLRDALAIVTVVGALVAFYGMIKLVSYLAGVPSP
jgi:hypothetical protein